MQSEREKIYKYINENVQEITAIELEVIADYILQEKQKSKIEVLLEMCNLLALTDICKVPEYEGCDVCPIWKKLEELQSSAESLGEK